MQTGQDPILVFLDKLTDHKKERDRADEEIDRLTSLIEDGYASNQIRSKSFSGVILSFLIEVARSRLQAADKFSRGGRLWLDRYSSSYSTPEIVAAYRSDRLSQRSIVDMGCGAGIQSIFFATNSSVVAFEKDPLRYRLAKLNAQVYDRENLRILNEDVLEKQIVLGSGDIIFSDPLRTAGPDEKTFSTLSPNPVKLLEHYGDRKNGYVFDLPPTMPSRNITLKGEREYISLRGRINRLTLYSPDLEKEPVSALILPEDIHFAGQPDDVTFDTANAPRSFLALPDEALLYSGLVTKAFDINAFDLFASDRRRVILTSDSLPRFLGTGEFFEVLAQTGSAGIRSALEKFQPARIIPRFEIDSAKYYDYVKSISNPVWVGESLYLFRNHDTYVLARKMARRPDSSDSEGTGESNVS